MKQEKALTIVQKLENYREEEAITYTNLAQMYLTLHQNEEAKQCIHQAVALFQQYAPDDPHYFATLASLAQLEYLQKTFLRLLRFMIKF